MIILPPGRSQQTSQAARIKDSRIPGVQCRSNLRNLRTYSVIRGQTSELSGAGSVYATCSGFGAEAWKATMSPSCVLVDAMTPTGSSIVLAPRQDQAMPHGFTFRFRPTTRFFLSRKTTSIGKRMNHIWIDEHGSMSMPVSGFSPARPSRPWLRAANDVAISNSEAMATPFVILIAAVFGLSCVAKFSSA